MSSCFSLTFQFVSCDCPCTLPSSRTKLPAVSPGLSHSLTSLLPLLLPLSEPLSPPPCHLVPLSSPGLSVGIICSAESFLTPCLVREPSLDSHDNFCVPRKGLITGCCLLIALYSSLDCKFHKDRKHTCVSQYFILIFYSVPNIEYMLSKYLLNMFEYRFLFVHIHAM